MGLREKLRRGLVDRATLGFNFLGAILVFAVIDWLSRSTGVLMLRLILFFMLIGAGGFAWFTWMRVKNSGVHVPSLGELREMRGGLSESGKTEVAVNVADGELPAENRRPSERADGGDDA
ncbi:hypothetical protein ACFONL_13150 [Camelimonas fluminis]|uniref:Uncharacterized protein n=1 Tax=Camelimonas fluminis TaxID=1576911 RepID=A0ABV7UJ16_9HYPH|nr:hypothetical protein [Camelimonas fluminis]